MDILEVGGDAEGELRRIEDRGACHTRGKADGRDRGRVDTRELGQGQQVGGCHIDVETFEVELVRLEVEVASDGDFLDLEPVALLQEEGVDVAVVSGQVRIFLVCALEEVVSSDTRVTVGLLLAVPNIHAGEATAVDGQVPLLVVQREVDGEAVLREGVADADLVVVELGGLGTGGAVGLIVEDLAFVVVAGILETADRTDAGAFFQTGVPFAGTQTAGGIQVDIGSVEEIVTQLAEERIAVGVGTADAVAQVAVDVVAPVQGEFDTPVLGRTQVQKDSVIDIRRLRSVVFIEQVFGTALN